MQNVNDCARDAYTCSFVGCATHVMQSHAPMTAAEARTAIVAAFGEEEAARIYAHAV